MPTETNILPATIPLGTTYVTGESVKNEDGDCTVKDKNPSVSLKIEYPVDAEVLPLAGGAVLSFPYKDFKPSPTLTDDEILKLVSDELNDISNVEKTGSTFDLLTRVRNAANAVVRAAGKKDRIRNKLKLPKVFISTYVGDDSEFDDKTDKPIADIIKICEIQYVPFNILEEIALRIFELETLSDVAGVSGKTFEELTKVGVDNYLYPLEFFPIFNMAESDIVRQGLSTTVGGFYTFDESSETIYVKFPDLSGKDSFGFAPDIWEERNIYLEVEPQSAVQRTKIDDFSFPPSIDFAGDFPSEFPESGSLTITIESNKEIVGGYLSPISATGAATKTKGLNTSEDALEIYTAPLLTQPVLKGTSPTFSILDEFGEGYVDETKIHLSAYYNLDGGGLISIGDIVSKGNIEEVGLASDLSYSYENEDGTGSFSPNSNSFFGEKNRPEVILFNSNRKRPTIKSNRQYTSPKITQAREVFANIRPKIYSKDQLPELWLKTSDVSTDSDGNYEITFPGSELDLINTEFFGIGGYGKFAFYAIDEDGQLARAPRIIEFFTGEPGVSAASPNGFRGSREIAWDSTTRIRFRGVNLGATERLVFTSPGGQELKFSKGSSSGYTMTVRSTEVNFFTTDELFLLGFTAQTAYSVYVETGSGKRSSPINIYVSAGDGDRPDEDPPLADLSGTTVLSFANNGSRITTEVPIDPGQNSLLKIKSRKPWFNGDYNLFAYIAVPEASADSLNLIELDSNFQTLEQVATPSSEGENIVIAKSIEFEFSSSFVGQDFYKIGNRKAGLKIPGDDYAARNFSTLIEKDHNFYIVITNQAIEEITLESSTLEDSQYFVLQIGNEFFNESAFVSPPYIYGLAAVPKNSENIISTFPITDAYQDIKAELGGGDELSGKISTFDKLDSLAIVFNGDGDINGNKRYKFFIGSNNIKRRISGKIEEIPSVPGQFVAYFRNVKISDTGDLAVYIQKKNKDYSITSSSQTVKRRGTYYLAQEDFEYDTERGEITLADNVQLITDGSISGLVADTDIGTGANMLIKVIPVSGSGIAIKDAGGNIDYLSEATFTSNFDVGVNDGTKEVILKRNIKESGIESMDKDVLFIPNGTLITSSNLLVDLPESPTKALAFLNLEVGNPHSIGFNKPEILSIEKGTKGNPTADPNLISIVGGEEYTVKVRSSKSNFRLLFDDLYIVKPKNVKQATGETDVFVAKFKAPKKLISSKCPEVAGSISNFGRNNAKFQLGDKFVVDVQKQMFGIADGLFKKKIPDLDDLKDLIENFPLRFINLNLDKVSIPTDLINSFCDMSFHLTADLKIALNGFQILMVPIQIIFCIIDVICALLNPVKIAKAVIRLFQCLYDLILLLPQISVPVMFIQLILHLLELIQCVIDKVLFMITVINEVIKAIELAIEGALFDALKSLEEILSEYLLDLKADISVLDPIISILSIFLQLLGLAFRFPCTITDDEDEFFCMDGSMVAGLILGKAITGTDSYNLETLIPVGQSYSDKTLEEAIADGTSDPLIDPADGDVCAEQTNTVTYLDSMDVDENTLRSNYANSTGEFNLTFAASATKSRKGFGSPKVVKFVFNEKGRNGFFNKKKIIDPEQSLDGEIYMVREASNQFKIETGNDKNLLSPIDGVKFLRVDEKTASVRPLILNLEVEVEEVDQITGVVTRTVEEVTRTFDNIPRMAILDDDFNVYFVEEDGIEISNDGTIQSIKAKIINTTSAPKQKFVKEDQEIDTDEDEDGDADDEAPVFDFPQLYFFDMRNVAEDIQTKCGGDFFNNDLLEDDPDDIADIVEEGQDCIEAYTSYIGNLISDIRTSMIAGEVPALIDVDEVTSKGTELEECLESVVDDMCIYVINTLTTQFKILDDTDETPLEDFVVNEIPDDLTGGFEISGPSLTGAQEYASGIGDSAEIRAGDFATIQITPRDSYDNPVGGDLSSKIRLEIVSDSTGSASIVTEDGTIFTKDGDDYFAKVTASSPGAVKLRARVCNKTVQAVTYADLADSGVDVAEQEVDCVPEADDSDFLNDTGALGALTKVDRILTIYFQVGSTVALAGSSDEEGSVAKSGPQAFGSKLEN